MINLKKKIENLFKKKPLKIYKTCDSIWMHNFYKALDTNDYRWLVVDYDEYSDFKLTENQEVELGEIWKELFNEYLELKKDQTTINNLRKRGLIANLQNRLFFAATLLKLIIKNPNTKNLDEIISELQKWKVRFDKKKPVLSEIERITKQLKQLKTRINLETSRYEKIMEKYKNKENVTIDTQIVNIGKILDLKYPIDKKTTVMSQWVSHTENAKKIIEDGRKDRNNR